MKRNSLKFKNKYKSSHFSNKDKPYDFPFPAMKLIFENFVSMKNENSWIRGRITDILGRSSGEKLVDRETFSNIQLDLNSHLTFGSSEIAGKLFVTILSSL